MMENTAAMLAYLDPQFNFVEVNSVYARGSGYTADELIGKNHFALFPHEENQDIFEEVRDSGEPARFHDKPFMFPDQPERGITYWDWTLVPVKDASGSVQGLMLSLIETTERKRAEKAIRESEERYRQLVELSPDAILIRDENTIVFINAAGARLLGTSDPEEIIGRSIMDFIHPDYQDIARERARLVRETGKALPLMEQRYIRLDGTVIEVEVAGATIAYQNRPAVQLIIRDITKRKRTEEALARAKDELEVRVQVRTEELRETNRALQAEIANRKQAQEAVNAERQRLNDVLDMLPAYLVLLTQDYHVAFANSFFRKRFGESQGRRCFEYLFGRTEPCENCETYKVLKTMTPLEWEWSGPDGCNYYIFDFPFTDRDGSNLIMEVGIDITERKKAEQALRKAHDELEAASKDLRLEIDERRGAEWRAEISSALTRLFWQATSKKEYLDATAKMLHDWTGCRHVGIRALDEQGNIPYISYVGFNRDFIDSESSLSIRKDQCACIRVISGRPDPQDAPAMTPSGSFWCNNTIAFVSSLTKEEQSRFRGVCVRNGFKSVCIIPICHADKTLGAIHLADERDSALTQRVIEVIESLAILIGEGIYRFHVEELLRRSEDSLARAQRIARLGNWDWDIIEGKLYWSDEIYRIFGLEPEQSATTYESFLSHVHPVDIEYINQSVNEALYEGKPYSIDHRILLPDGSERVVHEEAEVTYGGDGKPVRMVGTVHDITQLKRAEEELRALSRRLVEAQENERRAIARELHDEIGQSMTVLMLALDRAMHSPPDSVRSRLNEAQAVASEVVTQVRNLSLSLRPSMLDDLGLLPTLLWYFDRYSAQTKVQVDFKHAGLDRHFPPEVSTAAYRVVQEALINVVRHARVKEVMVRTWSDKRSLHLRIEDKGSGFDRAALPAGTSSGLSVMHERSLALGGKLVIETAPGAGTRVMAELPLSDRSKKRKKGNKNDNHSAGR